MLSTAPCAPLSTFHCRTETRGNLFSVQVSRHPCHSLHPQELQSIFDSFTVSHCLSLFLSHLERRQRQHDQNHTHQPETTHDLRFCHGSKRLLYKRIDASVPRLLIVMVQGCHLEHTSARTIFLLCIFKIGHLCNHRQRLHEEDTAKDWQ